MEIVSYIQSRLTFTNCLSSFLIVFSVVQLYYSVRCFRAHRMFFKMNKGKKKIHDTKKQSNDNTICEPGQGNIGITQSSGLDHLSGCPDKRSVAVRV